MSHWVRALIPPCPPRPLQPYEEMLKTVCGMCEAVPTLRSQAARRAMVSAALLILNDAARQLDRDGTNSRE